MNGNTILQPPVRLKGFLTTDQRVKISGAKSAEKLLFETLEKTDSSKG
jgi:hypothetical protein